MNHRIETDVLIVGCGIAGGAAALQLADAGMQVTVITKTREAHESNTYYAQGGIIYKGEQDSPDLLAKDIHRAGAGYCNGQAVQTLAKEGPDLVREVLLERAAVPFDYTDIGTLSLAREGGHSLARIVHAADATGKAIAEAMLDVIESHPNITLLTDYLAVDLIMSNQHSLDERAAYGDPRCLGAYLLEPDTAQIIRCVAQSTVLATGGLGQIYQHTTNPAGARGDGVAMATRAGARISNMEYVQFHPTTFAHPDARSFLISEAVRGEGARLVNASGEPFMQDYDAGWRDLAPRDIVARSIQAEMDKHNVSHVYLDLRSYISEAKIRSHFPTIYETCLSFGVDITQDLVPVAPAAHYACGGIMADAWGQTNLIGLYAIGEAACTGLHGANRLASTSLLEGLVWGDRAAQHIEMCAYSYNLPDITQVMPYRSSTAETVIDFDLPYLAQRRTQVRTLMWENVGLVRTTDCMVQTQQVLIEMQQEIETGYWQMPTHKTLLDLRNTVQVALLITTAALRNKVSAGCHYRLN